MTPRTRTILVWTIALLAGWSMLAALFTLQTYAITLERPGLQRPLNHIIVSQLPTFWAWAVLTPVVVWLGRRIPIERPHRARHLCLLLLASFVFALIHAYVAAFGHQIAGYFLSGHWREMAPIRRLIYSYGATDVMICWGILAGSQALTYFTRFQDRELRLVEAQLQSLKTQLHPHFLFNTLNAIAELIHQDTARAERTLTQLSDLLRTALSRTQTDEVPLKDEIDFLRNYVDIQQTLLQERLAVRWDVDDAVLDALVPGMLLQPLVENAIQHGIGPRLAGGTVWVAASRDGDRLRLQVADDGVGVSSEGTSAGIGLANTRARLKHLYREAFQLNLKPRPGGGTIAEVLIPFRT